jgi:hypothetical protein
MCQHSSPPGQGGEVRGHWTRGSTGAHPNRGVRSGAARRVAVLEPISVGRLDSGLHNTWQCADACPAPRLDLKPVCGGTRSIGYQQWPLGPPQQRL